jgi:hypothetical protein
MSRIRSGVLFFFFVTTTSAFAQETVFSRTVLRDKSAPSTVTDSFTVCDPAGQFTLSADASQVSSATVSVNGVAVLKQSDFNQNVAHLERQLSGIAASNQVAVQIAGAPGASLRLAVIGVMSCGLKIKSPASGAVISQPSILVTGTMPLSFGIDAGVSVNGAAASVTPGKFAALIRVDSSVTSITAQATDAKGSLLGKDSIPVSVQIPSTGAALVLRASPASGLAPLTVIFHLVTDAQVTHASIDFNGDGVADVSGATIDGAAFTYTAPGLYLPAATAIDASGASHTATAVVQVTDRSAFEGLVQARWGAMKDALRSGDIAAASQLIIPSARDRYAELFTALAGDMGDIDSILTPLSLVTVRNSIAVFEMLRTDDDGVQRSYEVRCALDDDGIWRLRAF